MAYTKQVIVMRNDLNMRKGKMVAQGSHASLDVFLSRLQEANAFGSDEKVHLIDLTNEMLEWINGSHTKICVRCESENELVSIYEKAKEEGLPVYLVTDSGRTEFKGVPTKTCLAIGPAEADKIDSITGHLKLL